MHKKLLNIVLTALMTVSTFQPMTIIAEDEPSSTDEPVVETVDSGKETSASQDDVIPAEEYTVAEDNITLDLSSAEEEDAEPIFYCNKEEHTHTEDCYKDFRVLTCENEDEDHEHSEECFTTVRYLICSEEEHTHNEDCKDPNYASIIADLQAENEDDNAQSGSDERLLYCGKEEHVHLYDCLREVRKLICEKEENTAEDSPDYHIHDDECFDIYYVYDCGKEEHTHTDECYEEPEVEENADLDMAGSTGVTSIDSFENQFVSGAKKDNQERYVWTANRNTDGHGFVFRVNYSTSGIDKTEPEGLEIRIPLHILKDREGNYADIVEMSVPHVDELTEDDTGIEYAYRIEDDEIVFFNVKEISAAVNGYFEVMYSMSKTPVNYQDMGESDDFWSTMSVNGHEATANRIPVYIDTTARIQSIDKRYPNLYTSWQPGWGEKPADADDYYFLVWEFRTLVTEDLTQPYKLEFTDTITKAEGYRREGSDLIKDENITAASVEPYLFKLSGESMYSANNTVERSTISGYRYDYVLTRHKKSDFSQLDRYNITNHVDAVLTPLDLVDNPTSAQSNRLFGWERPEFKYPVGHFQAFKRADGTYRDSKRTYLTELGMKAGLYSRYDLQELKEGNVTYLDDFDYAVWMHGYPYPWTLEDGADGYEPANYGVVPVTYELVDEGVYLHMDGGDYTNAYLMNSDDFQIDRINWGITMQDALYNEETCRFQTTTVTFTDDDTVTFYLKFGNTDSDFVEAGTYNLKTKEATVNNAYASEITGDHIIPADNCIAYKLVASNAHYYTMLKTVPNMRLKSSANVLNAIELWDAIAIRNNMNAHVYDNRPSQNGTEIFQTAEAETDFARITQKDSHIAKDAIASSSNKKKKFYTITWRVKMNEQATMGLGEKEYIEQNGGTFYDLIPVGQNVVLDSVSIQTNEGWLSENSYNVSLVNDYKNSGRVLLKVDVKDTFDYAYLYFDTRISWDSIKDFGTLVYNPVAYQTGNKSIAQGYPDDGGQLSKDKDYMTGLDTGGGSSPSAGGNGDAKRFIYSSENYDIVAITQATAGLTKHVKALEDADYSYDTWTYPNGDYSYRWRYMNTYNTRTKDMIFYDSLENYKVDGTDASDWYGTLQSIDTTLLKQLGINYKIYISTIEHLNIDDHHDITDSSVWTQVAENDTATLNSAKAVAVDIRKKTDGSDFVLMQGESVSVVLNMKAPSGATSAQTRVPVSYNNIYISDTVIDNYDNEQDFFIRHDYTAIRLIVTGNVKVHKVSAEDNETPIRNIKFRLRGTSDYGTEYDEFATTDKNGDLNFKKIEMGTYILSEYEGTSDWLEDHTEHTVVIDSEGKTWIDGNEYTETPITITNKPRVHADIPLLKKEKNTEVELQFAEDEWDPETMTKYAVALYGIEHDKDENGNTMGLTFGPALGQSYMTTFKSHTPSGTTASGNDHHCIHEDSWEEIVYWNYKDPYVYEQCISEGCTHSVNLTIGNSPIFNGTRYAATGDGPSVLYNEFPDSPKKWTNSNNNGGWGATNIRAVLNGVDNLTHDGVYARTQGLTEKNALIAAFPEILKTAIGNREVKYDSVYNAKTEANLRKTYDKLWLLSTNEIWTTAQTDAASSIYYSHPLETDGRYPKFDSITVSSSGDRSNALRGYNASASFACWWLRSFSSKYNSTAVMVYDNGDISGYNVANICGVSPCFTLSRDPSSLMNLVEEDRPAWAIDVAAQQAQNAYPSLNGVIPNTTFKLSGTSDYGNDIVKIEKSNMNGRITFKDVEQGTYTIQEIKESEGYILDDTKYTVTVDENGLVSTDLPKNKLYYEIENEPRFWNFNLRKVDAEDKNIWLQGATFHLFGTSDLGTTVDMTLESDANGKVEINDLEKGTYILQEVSAPTGVDAHGHTGTGGNRNYELDPVQHILTLDGDGKVLISGFSKGSTGEFYLTNERKLDGVITIYKKWQYADGDTLTPPQITISTTDPATVPTYVVTYDARGGHFDDNTTTNNVYVKKDGAFYYIVEGEVKEPTAEEGLIFQGWTVDKEGTIPFNASTYEFTGNMTIYAQWKDTRLRYAVALYGIEQDIDINGNTMGLTFGPATGADYINSFHAHEASGTTAAGNEHRCLHWDTWEEIVYWNHVDPYVYEQCVAEGCTHSVPLNIPSEIKNTSPLYVNYTGDGPSVLCDELQQNAKNWNAWGLSYGGTGSSNYKNTGGWGSSNIRAVLNGVDNDNSDGIVTTDDTFARTKVLTTETSLLGAFPTVLRDAIGYKAVKYDSVYNAINDANLKTTYDKLWLLSSHELGTYNEYGSHRREALDDGQYERVKANMLGENVNYFYRGVKVRNLTSSTGAKTGNVSKWYLRSVYSAYDDHCLIVSDVGYLSIVLTCQASGITPDRGISPCFALSR